MASASTGLAVLALAGCAWVPASGPTRHAVTDAPGGIQIVPITETVARQLLGSRSARLFSEGFGQLPPGNFVLGPGDTVEVGIWEAPPATLFGASSDIRASAATGGARPTLLAEQQVDADGRIGVPFAGPIDAAGRTLRQVEDDIVRKLARKANQPQVQLRLARNASANVTVVGEVANSVRMPLTPRNERLLDALAAAGGTRFPVSKVTVQVTRGNTVMALPLDTVIRDPRQNVPLYAGDVVTILNEPLNFTALGATGKNEEINFEAPGISLAQAVARSGGIQDGRADAQGVFIFRYENAQALDWPHPPVATTADGKVPVIYTVNLRDPSSFFAMQTFTIQHRDMLYVSNAPLAELQKFATVVYSLAFPVLNTISVTK
ncbi:MAG: polysaccharide biosynthesis/export family protein [Caldimonas sp.]